MQAIFSIKKAFNERSLSHFTFVICIASILCLGFSTGYIEAGNKGKLSFPEAHYPHISGIEWWYYSGIITDENKKEYGYFFTLFKTPGVQHAVFRITDLDTGVSIRKDVADFKPTGNPDALSIEVADERLERRASLRYDETSDSFEISISDRELSVELVLQPNKPYVLNGRGGYIKQSTAGFSAYYSSTSMSAEGYLTVQGERRNVTGDGWMDHQWGNWPLDPAAYRYDWFSLRFEDNTELMLYRFRDIKGDTLDRYKTGTYVDASGNRLLITDFEVEPIGHIWQVPGTAQTLPLRWHVVVPSVGLDFTIDTPIEDQYMNALIGSGYWEGVVYVVEGNKSGYGYLEMSGYSRISRLLPLVLLRSVNLCSAEE